MIFTYILCIYIQSSISTVSVTVQYSPYSTILYASFSSSYSWLPVDILLNSFVGTPPIVNSTCLSLYTCVCTYVCMYVVCVI